MKAELFLSDFLEKLKEVDWTKNIIYMFVYFLSIFFIFIMFVYPELQLTKNRNIEYRKAQIAESASSKEYVDKLAAIEHFKNSNAKMLEAFAAEPTQEDISSVISPFIRELKIEKVLPKESRYRSSGFIVTGLIDSPAKLYELIEALKNTPYVLSLGFPIRFDRRDEGIRITFEITAYFKN